MHFGFMVSYGLRGLALTPYCDRDELQVGDEILAEDAVDMFSEMKNIMTKLQTSGNARMDRSSNIFIRR